MRRMEGTCISCSPRALEPSGTSTRSRGAAGAGGTRPEPEAEQRVRGAGEGSEDMARNPSDAQKEHQCPLS